MRALVLTLLLAFAALEPAGAQPVAPAAPQPSVARPPEPVAKPASLSSGGLGSSLGTSALISRLKPLGANGAGLAGLPITGDAAPQCRAQCSKDRYVCGAGDDNCDASWRQCVSACRTAP